MNHFLKYIFNFHCDDQVHTPYIEALIHQLRVRFPHTDLLNAFSVIVDPSHYRGLNDEDAVYFGEEELKRVFFLFYPIFSSEPFNFTDQKILCLSTWYYEQRS